MPGTRGWPVMGVCLMCSGWGLHAGMLESIDVGTESTLARYPRMACDGGVCLMCSGQGLHAGMLGSIEARTESTHARYPLTHAVLTMLTSLVQVLRVGIMM